VSITFTALKSGSHSGSTTWGCNTLCAGVNTKDHGAPALQGAAAMLPLGTRSCPLAVTATAAVALETLTSRHSTPVTTASTALLATGTTYHWPATSREPAGSHCTTPVEPQAFKRRGADPQVKSKMFTAVDGVIAAPAPAPPPAAMINTGAADPGTATAGAGAAPYWSHVSGAFTVKMAAPPPHGGLAYMPATAVPGMGCMRFQSCLHGRGNFLRGSFGE
jgi:hypothetical protein